MSAWWELMSTALSSPLLQRSLLTALVVGVAAPVVGTYLVQRRLSLLGDGVGHVALTGVAMGWLVGAWTHAEPNDAYAVLGAVIAAVIGAVLIEAAKGGAGLGAALADTERFPRLALQMIEVGEEAGELDDLLLKVADTFDAESRRSIDRLLAALVPVLTLVMTALVALIMAAILMPLLSLTGSIH